MSASPCRGQRRRLSLAEAGRHGAAGTVEPAVGPPLGCTSTSNPTDGTRFNMADQRIGWVGAGRMGFALAERLLKAGIQLSVYNRTRAKAEPLASLGATVVDSLGDLADFDLVFVIVAESKDLIDVISSPRGLLSRPGKAPRVVIDSSTVSEAASAEARELLARRGCGFLAAPV